MALPLPQMGAGGFMLGAMREGNALARENLENTKRQLENKFYTPKTEAEIKQIGAQTGLIGSETAKNQFQVQNPQYMNPESYLYSRAFGLGGQGVGGNALMQGAPAGDTTQGASGSGNNIFNMPANDGGGNNAVNSLIQQKTDPLGYANKAHQQQANIDINNKLVQDASEQANNAVNMNYALDSMNKAYPELNWAERGAIKGKGPAISDAAQKFDHAAASLNNAFIAANQTGHITDKDIGFFSQLGVGRHLNKDAFNVLSGFNRAIQNRIKEKAPFYSSASAMGIPPNIYQPLYSMYLNERPVYDYDNSKPIKENQGSWQEYLTPEAVQAMQAGKPFSPRENAEEKTKTQKITNSHVTEENILHTMKLRNLSREEVLKKLREKGFA